MSARTSVQGKQNDNDYQRHNANRQHREGRGQDRFGQQMYEVAGEHNGCYYLLKDTLNVSPGPLHNQLVHKSRVRHIDARMVYAE